MENRTFHIIGRGLAGWHAKGIDVSSSGGDISPYTYWTGEKVKGYAAEGIDGCLVYDAKGISPENENLFIKLVISGPIVKPGLTRDEGKTALSYITVKTFEMLLREIPGIKFGTVKNGIVFWE